LALALTPDDATLLVVSGWGHALEGFTLEGGARAFAVDLPREPRAVVTSSDGATAFVAHALGDASVVDLRRPSAPPKTLELGMRGLLDYACIAAPSSSGRPCHSVPALKARQGFALARLDGAKERIYAPHVLVAPGEPGMSAGYGGANPWLSEDF